MKVALINSLYKPYARGGAEKHTELLAEGLKNSGHEYIVITTYPAFTHKPSPDSQEKIYYLFSFFYNLNKMPKWARLFWHFLDTFNIYKFFLLIYLFKKEKLDIVILNNQKGIGSLAVLSAKICNLKVIKILHDIQLLHPSGLLLYGKENILNNTAAKIYIYFNKIIFNRANLVISPSNWLLNLHSNFGFFKNSEKKVILNPITINFQIESRKSGLNQIIFTYAGQLEQHKGLDILLKSFAALKNQNIKLKIIGNGSLKNYVKTVTSENIIYTGYISDSDALLSQISNSDCIILPSICYENSPTIIYESLKLGVPVIASKIGGITELITDDNGYLFTPGDVNDLTKKMALFIEKPFRAAKVKNFLSPTGYISSILK